MLKSQKYFMLDFVHFVTPAIAPASQNEQSRADTLPTSDSDFLSREFHRRAIFSISSSRRPNQYRER